MAMLMFPEVKTNAVKTNTLFFYLKREHGYIVSGTGTMYVQ